MSHQKLLRDYGLTVVIAVSVAILIRSFLIEAYRIPGSSMRPTLEGGDTIFVAKWKYHASATPERGDVVVFSEVEEPKRDFIKRVVGIAGDTIELKQGHLVVNGIPLETKPSELDPYSKTCATEAVFGASLQHGVCWEPQILEDVAPVKVPESAVFVMGDLRMQSPTDAGKRRSWGVVPIALVKGKALWIWMSTEPHSVNGWFPQFRFERIFKKVE